MSDTHHSSADHGDAQAHQKHYIRIWGVLMVLLVISIGGPFVGSALDLRIVTLLTAFGIAFVKAYLVAKHFMHLNVEKPIVHYMLGACLAFLVVFFAAISPDVMNHEGRRWDNVAAKAEVDRMMARGAEGAEHGHHEGSEHGAAGGGEHAAPAAGVAEPAEPAKE